MALIARSEKTTSNAGSTAFANSSDPTAAEVNTDFNTAFTEVNGALNSANFADGAVNLAGTKLTGILPTARGGTGTPLGVRLILNAIAQPAASSTSYTLFYLSATEAYVQWPIPFAATVKNLRAVISSAQPSTGSLEIRLRVNGVDKALSLTIPASAPANTFYVDSIGLVDVVAGDLLTFSAVNGATSTAANVFITAEAVPA